MHAHGYDDTFWQGGGHDYPPGWCVRDAEETKAAAKRAYALLRGISRIPGTGDDGVISRRSLHDWCVEARRLCDERGLLDVGDLHLGQLLSNAPPEDDETWPCLAVCEVMEKESIRSHHLTTVRS